MLGQDLIGLNNEIIYPLLNISCNQYQDENFCRYINATIDFFKEQAPLITFNEKGIAECKKRFFLKQIENKYDETLNIFLRSLKGVCLTADFNVDLTAESLAESLCRGELNPTLSEFFDLSHFCKGHIKTLFFEKVFKDSKVLRGIGDKFINKISSMEYPLLSINFKNTKSFTAAALKLIKSSVQEIVLSTLNDVFKDEDIVLLLKRCKQLKRIDLSYCRNISDNVLFALAENNKEIESVILCDSYSFSAKAIESLMTECSDLQELDLSECDIDDDKALVVANNAKKLKFLDISYSPITEKGVETLLSNCPLLKKMNVKKCGLLSPEFLKLHTVLTC